MDVGLAVDSFVQVGGKFSWPDIFWRLVEVVLQEPCARVRLSLLGLWDLSTTPSFSYLVRVDTGVVVVRTNRGLLRLPRLILLVSNAFSYFLLGEAGTVLYLDSLYLISGLLELDILALKIGFAWVLPVLVSALALVSWLLVILRLNFFFNLVLFLVAFEQIPLVWILICFHRKVLCVVGCSGNQSLELKAFLELILSLLFATAWLISAERSKLLKRVLIESLRESLVVWECIASVFSINICWPDFLLFIR